MLARDTATPLYQQIKQRLQAEIEAGTLAPHSRLPSERELVRQLGVSRITVRQALGALVQQGYLYTAPGKGIFVSEREHTYALDPLAGFTASAAARGKRPSNRVLEAALAPATPALAAHLLLAPGEALVALVRLRLIDEQPVTLQHSWLPAERLPGLLERDLSGSLFELLGSYGIAVGAADVTLGARLATTREQALLGLADPAAVLAIETVNFDSQGRPIEFCLDVVRPQPYQLRLAQRTPSK